MLCCCPGGLFLPGGTPAFPTMPGWPKTFNGSAVRSPVIADIDHDGFQEVLLITDDPLKVHVYSYNGNIYNGAWPKVMTATTGTAPSVADLDGDKDLEIIVGADKLYAWHHTGEPVLGFPGFSGADYMTAAPAIGDLNSDGIPEIVGGNQHREFFAWDANGNVLSGFPKQFANRVQYTSAIGDIDRDGINEIIAPGDINHFYAFNYDGSIVGDIWNFLPPPTIGSRPATRPSAISMGMSYSKS